MARFVYKTEVTLYDSIMTLETVNLTGLGCSLIGTAIAGYSASNYFTLIHIHLAMLEMTLGKYLDGEQFIPSFRNTEESRKKRLERATVFLHIGMILIVLGFLLQVLASPSVLALFQSKT